MSRRFLSLACSWSHVARGVGGCTREKKRERERTRKNVEGRRLRTSGTGGVFARKWTRIGALCENEKVTKAEGKDVHIYA